MPDPLFTVLPAIHVDRVAVDVKPEAIRIAFADGDAARAAVAMTRASAETLRDLLNREFPPTDR